MKNYIIIQALTVIFLGGPAAAKKSWTYELTSVNTKSSNPDLLDVTLSVERISRGVFALSGEFTLNFDINEGDDTEVEVVSFRSTNGDGEYKSLPLEMSRRHFYDALNSHYKNVVMETFKDCSDLPYFEDEAPVPLEKKTYVLEKCQFSQDGIPNHLEMGTYKIILMGYGLVDWEVELIAEVEASNDLILIFQKMVKLKINKLFRIICVLTLVTLLERSHKVTGDESTWTFELKSITTKTSDPEKLSIDLDIVRVSRGVFAVTGGGTLGFDIVEDDNNLISSKTYRSKLVDSDFKVVPMGMSPTHFFKVLSTYYKNVLMDTLKDCSNFPIFEDEFVPPLEKKYYYMNDCQFTEAGFPSHLQEGFYKLVLIGTGEVDWEVAITVEIIHDV
ncbi:uncharacterized protein ACRADG_007024 [Cochliomyia hominivorax]